MRFERYKFLYVCIQLSYKNVLFIKTTPYSHCYRTKQCLFWTCYARFRTVPNITAAISSNLDSKSFQTSEMYAVSGDGCNTNTGWKGGAIRLIAVGF